MSTSLKGMAQAALDREQPSPAAALPARPGVVSMGLGVVELADGRVHLVDRQTRQFVGVAVNAAQAGRTRKFFA
jgi:hypothetical protein